MYQKEQLAGKNIGQLREIAAELGLPSYCAGQISDWLYKKQILGFDDMTNLSKHTRMMLAEKYETGLKAPVKTEVSSDGTKKYLFPVSGNRHIESVVIPDKDRSTLCVSTQVGCRMGCLFCATGKQGFHGNLTAGEILNQLISLPERSGISNIVYMGMGEPMDNLDNVLQSLEILTSEQGFAMSPGRITVSTIGIIPSMIRFLDESRCHLAISLHSPFEEERNNLVPAGAKHPLPQLIKTVRQFDFGKQRRISFEYIMFRGLNDTPRHTAQIARLLNGLHCRINLIRFHPVPSVALEGSDEETVNRFAAELVKKGFRTTVRASRGLDILAACGLLSTKEASTREAKG